MLDVHPPHAPTHTWRDFFIHIATISVGLLIAVGLEQTVEAIHRDHLRHTLEAELHQETLENERIADGDLRWMNVRLAWILDLKATVDEVRDSHGKVKAQPPPNPPLPPNAVGDIDLVQTAWDTARQSAQLELLPHQEALLYSKVDAMANQVLHQDVLTIQQSDVVASYLISRHSDAPHFELSQLSDRQLEDLSHAVATLSTTLQEQKQYMLLAVAAVECALKDEESKEDRTAELKAATARYADPRTDAQSPIFWESKP